MTAVFGADLELDDVDRARFGGCHLVSEHVHLIRRLIWSNRLYCPGPCVGRWYSLEPLPPCLDGGVARAGVRRK